MKRILTFAITAGLFSGLSIIGLAIPRKILDPNPSPQPIVNRTGSGEVKSKAVANPKVATTNSKTIKTSRQGQIFSSESAEFQVDVPGEWIVREQPVFISEDQKSKHIKTSFVPQAANYEIIVWASNISDAGYQYSDDWTHSAEIIEINGKEYEKLTLRKEGVIKRITVIDILSHSYSYWIEINFSNPPTKKDLKKVNKFLKSFVPR